MSVSLSIIAIRRLGLLSDSIHVVCRYHRVLIIDVTACIVVHKQREIVLFIQVISLRSERIYCVFICIIWMSYYKGSENSAHFSSVSNIALQIKRNRMYSRILFYFFSQKDQRTLLYRLYILYVQGHCSLTEICSGGWGRSGGRKPDHSPYRHRRQSYTSWLQQKSFSFFLKKFHVR